MQVGGRYQLHEKVGTGGMGVVYRATDQQTGQIVAVKQLRQDVAERDPDILTRFLREAEALRELNHPHIVKVLDTAEQLGSYYIIMEYVPAGSLRDLLDQRGKLSVEHTLEIALDLTDALTRAHRLRIIHRDLKPANVLIAEDGSPRLTDFGVAQIGTKPSITGIDVAVGTLDYLSPEALSGVPASARTDIWSFGIMLYEMLAGQRPFVGETSSQVLTQILTAKTPDLEALRPDVPVALADLIYRMLQKEVSARIPTLRLIGLELETILSGAAEALLNRTSSLTPLPNELSYTRTTPVTPPTRRRNFPAQTTPFIGRQEEMAGLGALLADPNTRLITILGPGGIGKTRLSIAAAEQESDHFQDGIYFVPLAPLGSSQFILPQIADALDFTFFGSGTQQEQLLAYLDDKHLLLVMDNFEHVVEGAGLMSEILSAAPGVKILVSSRERLRLAGEHIFDLDGLKLPGSEGPEALLEYASVQLFMESARRAAPDFELNEQTAPHVAAICRDVQGLPLALELAAGWLELLPVDEIAREIARSLDFLETNLRDTPSRHRSIRAVFDYSWDLMTPEEREAFRRISVFRGGFERDTGLAVAETSLRTLMALVNKSALRRSPTGRFEVHELLRQYAFERLSTDEAAFRRTMTAYIAHFADFVAAQETVLRSRDERPALTLIDREIENIRAAWWWAVEWGQLEQIERIFQALNYFFDFTGSAAEAQEMFGLLERKLSAGDDPRHPLLWKARARLASYRARLGGYEEARRVTEQAAEIFQEHQRYNDLANALNTAGYAAMMAGDYAASRRLGEAASEVAVAHGNDYEAYVSMGNLGYLSFLEGDYARAKEIYEHYTRQDTRLGRAFGLNNLGEIWREMGDLNTARRYFDDAYAAFTEMRHKRGMGFSLNNLAGIDVRQGDFRMAESRFRESLRLHKEMGDRAGIAHSESGLGNVAFSSGRYEEAEQWYTQALDVRRAIGELRTIAYSLGDLATVATAQRDYARASTLHEESLAIHRELNDQMGIANVLFMLGIMQALAGGRHLVEDNFRQVLAIGESTGNMIVIAQATLGLGEVAFYNGQFSEAISRYHRALMLAVEAKTPLLAHAAILGFAGVLLRRSEPVQAAELVGLLRDYAYQMPINQAKSAELCDDLRQVLNEQTLNAALDRGSRLDVDTVVQRLLSEFAP